MLSRFNHGTIVDFIAGEDIKNNDLYVLDPETKEIRKAKECNEWLTCQLVYVFESLCGTYDIIGRVIVRDEDVILKKGTKCRCWMAYLVL